MTTILRGWFLTAMIAVIGAQAAASEPETPARVSVVFVKPEVFTDAGYSKTERSSPAILLQLQRFIADTGARYLPESMRPATPEQTPTPTVPPSGQFTLFGR